MINYVKPALKDIVKFPDEIKADLMYALAQLDVGLSFDALVTTNAVHW